MQTCAHRHSIPHEQPAVWWAPANAFERFRSRFTLSHLPLSLHIQSNRLNLVRIQPHEKVMVDIAFEPEDVFSGSDLFAQLGGKEDDGIISYGKLRLSLPEKV